MVITALKKSKSNRYLLVVDGKKIGLLYASELKKYSLQEDAEIDENTLNELYGIMLVRAKKYVFHLLAKRDYTIHEIRGKLEKNELDDTLVDAAIVYFKDLGYLDDAVYASRFIRTYSQTKSLKQIRYQLAQKGISRESLEDALNEAPVNDEGSARRHFDKKRDAMQRRYGEVDYKKIGDYLMRKGYEYAIVSELIKEDKDKSHST